MEVAIRVVFGVVLQVWQHYLPLGASVVLSMTALRILLPLALTVGLAVLLHRTDNRWHPVPMAK